MIKDVPLTGISVDDQEAALDFYTNKLGLEKIQDKSYGEDARWITVSPAEMGIEVVLKKAEKEHEKAQVGRSDGAPYRYPWGIGALLMDQDGSPILLRQESGDR